MHNLLTKLKLIAYSEGKKKAETFTYGFTIIILTRFIL